MSKICRERTFRTNKMVYKASSYLITDTRRIVMFARGEDTDFLVCVLCENDYPLLAHILLESRVFSAGYFERFYLDNGTLKDYLVSFKTPHCYASELSDLIDTAVLSDPNDSTVDFV